MVVLAAILLSIAKPLLLLATFVPWAWLISSKLDKDARYFHQKRQMWNGIHLAAGVAALAAGLGIPIFWIGWPVSVLVLSGPVLAYWKVRNDSVPQSAKFYLTSEGLAARLAARRQSRAARAAMVRFVGPDGAERKVPVKDDPLYPVHILAEDLIGPALESRATQVDVSVGASGATVSQVVDGLRYKREPLRAEMAMPLLDYLKSIAGLNVEDRRRRQKADFSMVGPRGKVQITLTTAGSSNAVQLRVVFDQAKNLNRPFDGLGLLPSQLEALRTLADPQNRHGIVLVGAPPGHGLTTSAYSFTARHDAYTSNIKTLEREILLRIDGVDHARWDPAESEADYATKLQSILRRDPDIVLVMDVADQETARVATEPGLAGPLLYVPMRSASIVASLADWARLVGDSKRAVSALRTVTNQRLLRTLCPNCRQPYVPTAEQLAKMRVPAGKVRQLYQAGGKVQVKNKIEPCPVCGGTGYLGQTGAFEVLMVDDEARRLLAGGDVKGVLAHARRNKMIYLQEAALSKIVAGETTIEEVVRVTAPPRPAAGGGSKPRSDPAPATTGQ
jgi:type II secretory ATPase GspE/PulE/Tfp pilus assembly ATPase PilB-like protein